MNYFNSLCELNTLNNTVHLSEKGAQQINEFREYVTPLIPDIRKGDAAKASIAEYYLDRKEGYTDGVKKILEPLVEQLGVSNGYISQIKKAREFKASIASSEMKQWVDEHPISVQYELAKADHHQLMDVYKKGEHCTLRQARGFRQPKTEGDTLNTATPETKTEYQLQQERYQAMADSDEFPLLRDAKHAQVFCAGNRKAILAAAAQVLYNIKYQDPELEKILVIVNQLSQKALEKPLYVATGIAGVS
jgi:hypothetical protein